MVVWGRLPPIKNIFEKGIDFYNKVWYNNCVERLRTQVLMTTKT